MKRSTQVAAPLLAAAAMGMLAGCHQQQMQRCVDENNKVVDQSFCQQTGQTQGQPQQQPDGHGGFIFVPVPIYHYYYGGWGGYGLGSVVGGGSYAPTPGVRYSTTARGGFGGSFAGSDSSGHGSSSGEGGHGSSGGAGE